MNTKLTVSLNIGLRLIAYPTISLLTTNCIALFLYSLPFQLCLYQKRLSRGTIMTQRSQRNLHILLTFPCAEIILFAKIHRQKMMETNPQIASNFG